MLKGFVSPLYYEGYNIIFLTDKKLSLDKRLVVPILSNMRTLLLKCTGNESALTPVHFDDGVLSNTKLAAMVKGFGLKSSNFLSGYYQCMSK